MSRRKLNAADLTTALVLEERVLSPDGGGGWTESWQPLGTLWADLRASRGSEREQGGRAYARVTHSAHVRAAPPDSPRRPRADQRFVAGGRVLNILAVAEAGSPDFLTCWCEEGTRS